MDAETQIPVDEQRENLPAPTASKKKKFLIAGAAVIALLSAGGAAFMFMGGEDPHPEAEAATETVEIGFVEVPPMVVNLRTSGGQPRFLKVHFLIVPSSAEAKTSIEAKLPLIIDRYQPFLRELRPEDLSGSAAVYRIKEEMMVRAGKIVGPASIRDILIQDLIEK